MDYKDLATLYHMDSTKSRDAHINQILKERRENPSTFVFGFLESSELLFLAVPRELSLLTQNVLRRERKVSNLFKSLPGIAGNEVLRSLVLDEVVMSNDIENIYSTRRQIEHAIEASSGENPTSKRFGEFAKLYIELSYGEFAWPETPADIRRIYDTIMDGEKLDNPPDGTLFRKDAVYITDGMREVHAGLVPESAIVKAMENMIELVNSPDIPELYSALASHYIFEYAHPFYDGNGRTGRYLLSMFLEAPLSRPTALSLSRVMAENRSQYYQAFASVENPLNHRELTFFVIAMHELILKAQDGLIERLEGNLQTLDRLHETMAALRKSSEYSGKELDIIFGLLQQWAFGTNPSMKLEIMTTLVNVGTQQTRKYLAAMEKKGIVKKTRGRNPITFALTDGFVRQHMPYLCGSTEVPANEG